MKQKIKKFLGFVVTLVTFEILFCLILEGSIRIFNPQIIVPAHTIPAFGNPNAWKSDIYFKGKNYFGKSFKFTINKNHFRGLKDYTYEKPEKTIRIMGFGRSVMLGASINDDETLGYFLEKTLNEQIKNFDFEFFNVAKGGWSVVNHLIYLKNEGIKYSPDLIIISRPHNLLHFLPLPNIAVSKMSYQRTTDGKVKIFLEDIKPNIKENYLIEKLIRQLDKIPFYFELTKYSHLLNLARKKMSALEATGAFNKKVGNDLESFIKSINLKDSEKVEWIIDKKLYPSIFKHKGVRLSEFIKGNKHTAELMLIMYQLFIDRIIDFAIEKKVKILVIETPKEKQVLEIVPPPKGNSYFPSKEGVLIKRLLADFISFQKKNKTVLFFPGDVHFLPSGSHLAAILIYNFIVQNRLLTNIKSNSQIDWLSPEISNLIQLSNQTIQKEIDTSRYPLYVKGWKDIQGERYAEAEANLSKYLEVSKNPSANFLLCYSFFLSKKYSSAKECLFKLPKHIDLAFLRYQFLAEIYLIKKETETALKTLNEWKETFELTTKRNPKYLYLKGLYFWQAKKMKYAELHFKMAADENPKNYLFPFTLGTFYFNQERYENSIQELKRATSLNPNDSRSYLFLSMVNFKTGNFEEGNRLIKEFIWKCEKSCEEILKKDDWL